jgi:enamine deaminase RidA (YjgF/YER057c/UK114 family)
MRALPIIGLIPTAARGTAEEVRRYRMPGSDLPVSAAVELPAGTATVHLCGFVPPLRPEGGFGDTRTQTRGVLRGIDAMLRRIGLGLGDVVRMQVFLVADPDQGGPDLAGFSAAYREFFGTADQPNTPARSIVQVVGLTDPGWRVEIEITAARPRR